MTRVYWFVTLLLIVGAAGVSAWTYPSLPQQIPTHWNIRGEIDAYGNKDWALFLLPGMMVLLPLLFYFLPALSPKHFEVDSFRSTYLYIMVLITALFVYMHGVILYAVWKSSQNAGAFNLTRPMSAGLFLFFALLGNVMGKIRKNFYIGVRVPWTLASDRVWNDTHRLAAWVMVASGLVGFVLTISGLSLILALVVCIGSMMIPMVYSFFHYKALERAGELGE
jgi:uncharacterized membrane protein